MNFAFDASKTQGNAATTTSAATPGGFTFGATGAGDAGKQMTPGLTGSPAQNKPGGLFGSGITTPGQSTGLIFSATPSTSAPTIGVTFGSSAQSTPTTGLTFGAAPLPSSTIATSNTTAPTGFSIQPGAPTGFNLNSTTTTTPALNTGLSFGAPTADNVAKRFIVGGGAQTTTALTNLTFGTPNSVAPSTTGFTPGSTTTTATPTTTPSFNFGIGATTTPTATGLPQDAAKTAAQTGFTLTPSTTTGFGITSTPAATTAPGFSLGTATTTSATPGFTFGTGTTAASTTGFMLNKTTTAVTTPSSIAAITTHTTLGTTTTVSSSASGVQPGSINFCQLEESINKWTLELEEQEKVFVNQATQVNAWDKLLIANGEKIVALNQEVERVKLEQQQLEHELDYIVGQQKELQDCLVPLEKELASLSVSDPEREYTYRLAESIDTQLKQMSEDLKEIIEHLNEANRIQDSSDPIVQIGKILNAHMNSLQWLDQRTSLLRQKIQQIDQMHQNFRQENERSFNLAYN